MIQLYNFLENNNDSIVNKLLSVIPKEIPAYSRANKAELKQSLEYLLEAYTDLLVTGEDDSQKTYFKYLSKVRVAQSFNLGDITHKLLLFLSVIRPMLQEHFRVLDGDGLGLYNKAVVKLESSTFHSVTLFLKIYQDYLKTRISEHDEYLQENNEQLGVDLSKFILFKG